MNKRRIIDLTEEIEAVLMLEYRNKNHLSGNSKLRNEELRAAVREIRHHIVNEDGSGE